MTPEITVEETKTFKYTLGDKELESMLRARVENAYDLKYYHIAYQFYIDVPGGGDYSNMRLKVGEDVNLIMEVTATRKSVEKESKP